MVWRSVWEGEREKGQRLTWHISIQNAYWYTRRASRPQLDIVRLNQHTYPSQAAGQMLNCSLGGPDHYRGTGRSSHPTMIHNNCSWYHRREWVGRGMGDCGLRGSCGGGKTSRARPEDTGPPLFGDRRNRGPVFFFFFYFMGSFVENREQKGASTRPAHQVTRPTYSAAQSPSYALAPGQGFWFVLLLLFLFICFDLFLAIKCHSPAGHESSLPLTDCGDASLFILPEPAMHGSPFWHFSPWSTDQGTMFPPFVSNRKKGGF